MSVVELEPMAREKRQADYAIQPLLVKRWSPRAMSGEPLTNEELMPLFEAARWAPSSFNNQPWRFIYSVRNSSTWSEFLGLLVEGNQVWAKNAAVLIVVASKKTFDYNGKASITHSFDAGAAWENLALEAAARNLVAHGMQGFDYAKAKSLLNIPDDYTVECMIAIGKPGRIEDLPLALQEKEFPSSRKLLRDIIMPDRFR